MNDPAFLQSVLENLPGVDPQSEAVRSAMGAITGQKKEEEEDKKKKDEEKKWKTKIELNWINVMSFFI